MLLGVVSPLKQPNETYLVEIDFTNDLDPTGSEVIVTRNVTSRRLFDGTDTTNAFLSGAPTGSAATCAARIAAGMAGERHRVQMQIITNIGNVYEHEIDVEVDEI